MGILDEAIREHLQLKRRRGADPTEVERLEREALGPVRRGPRDHAELAMDDRAEVAMDESVGLAVDDSARAAVDDPRAASSVTYSDEEMEHEWVESGDGEGLFDYEEEPGRAHEAGEPEHAYEAREPEREHEAREPGREAPRHHEVAEEPEREAPRHREIAEEWDSHEPLDFHEPAEPASTGDALDEEPLTAEYRSVPAAPTSRDSAPPRDSAAPLDAPSPDGAPPPDGAGGPSAPPPPSDADRLDEATAEYDVEAEHRDEREGEDVLEETPEFLQDTPDHDRLWFEQKPPRDFDLDG
jgi:hypothetical protein